MGVAVSVLVGSHGPQSSGSNMLTSGLCRAVLVQHPASEQDSNEFEMPLYLASLSSVQNLFGEARTESDKM